MGKIKEKQIEQEKYLISLSCCLTSDKKSVDYERINSLYKSKEKSNIYEKTKNKVEKEEGLTFKPMINKTEYNKRILSNFIERNTSNNKDKILNEYNKNNFNNDNFNNKKFDKKEKEKIVKEMIDRLYTNIPNKDLSSCCDKYIRGISHNNSKCYKKKL